MWQQKMASRGTLYFNAHQAPGLYTTKRSLSIFHIVKDTAAALVKRFTFQGWSHDTRGSL